MKKDQIRNAKATIKENKQRMNREKKEDSDSMFKGISKSRLNNMKWHEFASISLRKLEDRRKIDFEEQIRDGRLENRSAANSMIIHSTDLSRYSEARRELSQSAMPCGQDNSR